MSKENLQIKAIRYFYDIPGTIDEYAYQELSHFGNNMYMLFITTILGSLLLSLLTNTDIMGDCLIVVFFYAIYKQGKLVNKLGIDKIEIEASELKATQGKMLKRSLLETLIVTLLYSPKIKNSGSPFSLNNRFQITPMEPLNNLL